MPKEIKLWRIQEESLAEWTPAHLDLEARLETWIERDVSILSPDLLVIGRQVETDFGGVIDLLCLNARGDLVVVELKRDRTPREVTAQALETASWVRGLGSDDISEIAGQCTGAGSTGIGIEK